MKSIGTDPSNHGPEGDERIRTAEQFVATDPAYVDDLAATVRDALPVLVHESLKPEATPWHAALNELAALARAAVARAGTEEQ